MAGRRARRGERGAGLVGTAFGAVVFVAFLAVAAHTLVGLYATSVVTSVTWDAAHSVAISSNPDDRRTRADAESNARASLSAMENLSFTWLDDGTGAVGLEVEAARPSLLPAALAGSTGLTRIHRTVWVREEVVR